MVGVDGGGGSFSYFTGGGPTVKHSKFDHLSPGSSPGVARLSVCTLTPAALTFSPRFITLPTPPRPTRILELG